MNVGIRIKLDEVRPAVARMLAALNPEGRRTLHKKIGHRLQNLIRDHLLDYAQGHHKTAEKLGAQPTGFWSTAVESVSMPSALQTDEQSARLELASPGMARAFGPVDILPNGHPFLTLPVAPEAYGNRIGTKDNPRFPGGFFFQGKSGGLLYGIKRGEEIYPLYLLVASVHQEQDRTILPSDEDIVNASIEVTADYFQKQAEGHTDLIKGREAA